MGGIDTSKPKASLEKINTNWGQISSGSDGQAPVCTADELALKGGEITDQNTSDACRTQLNAVGADLRQVREDLRALVNGTYKVEGKNVTKVDKLEDVCPNLAALDPGTFGGSIGAFSTQAIAEGNACVKAAGNLYTTKDDAERAAKGEEAAALIVPVKVKPTTLQLVPEVTIATLWVELYTALAKHFGKDFTAMIELGKDPAVWKDYNSALAMLKNAVSRAIDTEADKVKTKAELVGNFPADLVALINKLPDGDEKAFYDMVVKPRVEEWMNDNIDYLSR